MSLKHNFEIQEFKKEDLEYILFPIWNKWAIRGCACVNENGSENFEDQKQS